MAGKKKGQKRKRIGHRRGKLRATLDSAKLDDSVDRGTDASNCVGDPPPTTPFDVVYTSGLLRLRRYRTERATRSPPVLLVYSLIKRPYVLDLLPDRSVVRSLLREGLSVYLADWLPPRPEDTDRRLQDYIDEDLAHAVDCIRRLEAVNRIALVGCCLGGFLAAVYAALHPENVERLMVFALPFESRPPFAPVAAEYLAGVYGNIPAWWLRSGLNSRVPDRAGLSAFVATELGEPELVRTDSRLEPSAVERELETWFGSDVPFAGRLFGEVMGNAYGQSQFASSELIVGDRRVALGEICCPVLNVCAENDRVVPPRESLSFVRHVGSRHSTNLVFTGGHLGLMVSRAAHASLWPHVGRWLAGKVVGETPDAARSAAA